MDAFFAQYLETALWSTNDESDESGGNPLDQNYGPEDIDAESLARMQADCDAFRARAGDMLAEHADPTAGAHDFWLNRNGHGAGFWDGDWPVNGAALDALASSFGECNLYVGDDGKIHTY